MFSSMIVSLFALTTGLLASSSDLQLHSPCATAVEASRPQGRNPVKLKTNWVPGQVGNPAHHNVTATNTSARTVVVVYRITPSRIGARPYQITKVLAPGRSAHLLRYSGFRPGIEVLDFRVRR